jgi:hypothetical protein
MKTIIGTALAFMLTTIVMFADSYCPPTTPCEGGKAYPYKVCEDGVIKTKCITNPSEDPTIIRANLPLYLDLASCVKFDYAIDGSFAGTKYSGVPLVSGDITVSELQEAIDKWNCICGYDGMEPDANSTGISFVFSYDERDFDKPDEDPCSVKMWDGNNCDGSVNTNVRILFNFTERFRNGVRSDGTEKQIMHMLMNNTHIYYPRDDHGNFLNLLAVQGISQNTYPEADIYYYNVLDLMISSIAEIVGLGVSSDECGCDNWFSVTNKDFLGNDPINDPYQGFTNPFGDYYGLGGAENRHSAAIDCDKYAFMLLYCPDDPALSDCYEAIEEPRFPEGIYRPNPTDNEFHIMLTLPNTAYLRLRLTDMLGNTVMSIYDGITTEGEFSKDISLNNLSTGIYYLRAEYNGHTNVQKIAKY